VEGGGVERTCCVRNLGKKEFTSKGRWGNEIGRFHEEIYRDRHQGASPAKGGWEGENAPDRLFMAAWKLCRGTMLPMPAGMVPLSWLPVTLRSTRYVALPRLAGSPPVSWLSCRCSSCRGLPAGTVSEIDPVSLFPPATDTDGD